MYFFIIITIYFITKKRSSIRRILDMFHRPASINLKSVRMNYYSKYGIHRNSSPQEVKKAINRYTMQNAANNPGLLNPKNKERL